MSLEEFLEWPATYPQLAALRRSTDSPIFQVGEKHVPRGADTRWMSSRNERVQPGKWILEEGELLTWDPNESATDVLWYFTNRKVFPAERHQMRFLKEGPPYVDYGAITYWQGELRVVRRESFLITTLFGGKELAEIRFGPQFTVVPEGQFAPVVTPEAVVSPYYWESIEDQR